MPAVDQRPGDSTRGGCPVLPGFDPLAPSIVADPYAWLARARREAPIFYIPEYGEWCVTRHADCEEILRDPVTYSSREMIQSLPPPADVAQRLPHGWIESSSLVNTDPPRHTRLRKLAQRAFTPRLAAAQTEFVSAWCDELIDGFVGRGRVDLVTAYTRRIPLRVVAHAIGIPADDVPTIHGWIMQSLAFNGDPGISADGLRAKASTELELLDYVSAMIADRRRSPRGEDDFVTTLVSARDEDGGPGLAEHEIAGIIAGAITAGGDTASITIGHMVHALLTERRHWDALVADPSRADAFVEETLRLRNPGRGVRRVATRPVRLGGRSFPEGTTFYVHLGSAGHDEAVFDDPERFDPDRPTLRQHLGFGKGTHFCLGAPLARVETRVGLQRLAARMPSMRLVPGHELRYAPSVQIPSLLDGLVVEWD